jgi:hypothetical protein
MASSFWGTSLQHPACGEFCLSDKSKKMREEIRHERIPYIVGKGGEGLYFHF